MKNIICILFACLCMQMIQGQVPQKIGYQAVIRDASKALLANQDVVIRVTILRDEPSGTAVFSETHHTTTNGNGLASILIGEGASNGSNLSMINWAFGPYFLKIDTDPNGGGDFSISGTTELVSVPYALFAERSGNAGADNDWIDDMPNNLVHTPKDIALITGGSTVFKVNANAPIGVARLEVGTNGGIGVQGNTNIGYGVRGQAGMGVGVHAVALNAGTALLAEAVNGIGIKATSDNNTAISADADANIAVLATTDSGIGLKAVATSGMGIDVKSGTGIAIRAVSDNKEAIVATTSGASTTAIAANGGNESNAITAHAVGKPAIEASSQHMGVNAVSELDFGVKGLTNADVQELLYPEFIGLGTNDKAGVRGFGAMAYGGTFGSTKVSGVLSISTNSNGVTGNTKSEMKDRAGVYGAAVKTLGVFGISNESIGVYGSTSGDEEDIVDPGSHQLLNNENVSAIMGVGGSTFGVVGTSFGNAGILGMSTQSNGTTGYTSTSADDRAGATGLATTAAGVLGWSMSGSGVRGKSDTGVAGEFEGEVHIENGMKNAKLKIEEMETDNNAPCLVWSGDKYVKMKDCWAVEEEEGIEYFVSDKGIRIVNGENVVFEVEPDGTSFHAGFETFEAGLEVPAGEGLALRLLPNDGISVYNYLTEEYLWHADLNGNSFAANSFFTQSLNANEVSANVKQFKIDHPLDPENKYLIHTSVESDERVNVYSGNITTDDNGLAIVEMPDWFEALNIDFRYQLTSIGVFAKAIILEEFSDGQFVIQTDLPHVKVSWQLTGVRNDQWAKDHPTQIEVDKIIEH